MIFKGKVWKFGDNISTELMMPGSEVHTRSDISAQEAARNYCMHANRPGWASAVQQGDIIVAGRNFGCGSSREHAPLALREAGIRAVIARSFARIFYRSAFNIGLPLLESGEAAEHLREGEKISVDLSTGKIENVESHETASAQPIPDFMRTLIRSGGLVEHVRQNKLKKKTVR